MVDVTSWLNPFDTSLGVISLQMMIETIEQRSEYLVCTCCSLKRCVMSDTLKPRNYLIFNACKADRRVFWNSDIAIGAFRYKLIGVAKHSPGHFFGDVFDPATNQWTHLNSIPESMDQLKIGFTLELLGDENIEGLIPGSHYLPYIRQI